MAACRERAGEGRPSFEQTARCEGGGGHSSSKVQGRTLPDQELAGSVPGGPRQRPGGGSLDRRGPLGRSHALPERGRRSAVPGGRRTAPRVGYWPPRRRRRPGCAGTAVLRLAEGGGRRSREAGGPAVGCALFFLQIFHPKYARRHK